jgi:lactobin A/cerein 7B family class IIb bacteriocin
MMNTYSTFNENSYGVQALSHSEMQEIDGGWIPLVIIGAAILLGSCDCGDATGPCPPDDPCE